MLTNPQNRIAILAPHRDDETLGLGEFIFDTQSEGGRFWVIFMTSGASPEQLGNDSKKTRVRRSEAIQALKLLGIPKKHTQFFPVRSRKTYQKIGYYYRELSRFIRKINPHLLLVPPYEGGHPDHDVASYLGFKLKTKFPRLTVFEYALYNWKKGRRIAKQFLDSETYMTWHPSENAKKAKTKALNQYHTQYKKLASEKNRFLERFRIQPVYDYTKPPSDGKLLYERWNAGINPNEVLSKIAEFEKIHRQHVTKKRGKKTKEAYAAIHSSADFQGVFRP